MVQRKHEVISMERFLITKEIKTIAARRQLLVRGIEMCLVRISPLGHIFTFFDCDA